MVTWFGSDRHPFPSWLVTVWPSTDHQTSESPFPHEWKQNNTPLQGTVWRLTQSLPHRPDAALGVLWCSLHDWATDSKKDKGITVECQLLHAERTMELEKSPLCSQQSYRWFWQNHLGTAEVPISPHGSPDDYTETSAQLCTGGTRQTSPKPALPPWSRLTSWVSAVVQGKEGNVTAIHT